MPRPTDSQPFSSAGEQFSDMHTGHERSLAMRSVAEFHRAFGLTINTVPTLDIPEDLAGLRANLIAEEVSELDSATKRRDLAGIADALGDIVYVAYGAALTYGIDLDAVLAEIHRSNMSKLDRDGRPVLRDDGKVLKSESYQPPDIASVLSNQSSPGDSQSTAG